MQRTVAFTLLVATLFFSCRREELSDDCLTLKEGMLANDAKRVETAIANFIEALPSQDYNTANINQLCQQISASCHLSAETLCFDCIETLPSQTEIKITFPTGASSQTKVIDLTYTAANKIVYRNMHD